MERAPAPQAGYNVVFQPVDGHTPPASAKFSPTDLPDGSNRPEQAWHRPDGLAVGADGALYVSDDVRGRIYRIVYQGGGRRRENHALSEPALAAPKKVRSEIRRRGGRTLRHRGSSGPERRHDARCAEGDRIYRGEVGGAACTGCHGRMRPAVPGPESHGAEWLWSDGSCAAIAMTIRNGVMQPKQYRRHAADGRRAIVRPSRCRRWPPMCGASRTVERGGK